MAADINGLGECEALVAELTAQVTSTLSKIESRLNHMAAGYMGTREALAWRDDVLTVERETITALEALRRRLTAARMTLYREM